jgi:trehalose 6-phosphate phosphatase
MMSITKQVQLDSNKFLEILNKHEKVLFIFDYDGTLTELVRDHNAATMSDDQIAIINKLVKTANTKVSIVTGRALDNLKYLLGGRLDESVLLYGTHGAEAGEVIQDEKIRKPLDEIRALLTSEEDILFEDKPISLTIHYKTHPNKEDLILRLEKIAEDYKELFRVQHGHQVFEYLPKNIDKGIAIRDLHSKFKDYFPIFIGDDLTDNFGFKVINEINGLSVQVGERISEREAGYLIDKVDDTYKLINLYLEKQI